MHRSEWSSMLLNMLTNSIKAVKRVQRTGRFLILVGTAGAGFVFLEFMDNGDGIPRENRERVFDAFFTTTGGTSGRDADATQAIGTGLGLKIIADIAESAGMRPGEGERLGSPSERMTPLSKDNCWRRSMFPKLEKAGLGWANFLVRRRTHATLMKALGVDGKLVADQLGQILDVNQNVSTQSPVESRIGMVNKLEQSLMVM